MQAEILRYTCNNVRSFLTDWGAEANIADAADWLPTFCKRLVVHRKESLNAGRKPKPALEQQPFLFPNCMAFPGSADKH
jgi:hypothetical protein